VLVVAVPYCWIQCQSKDGVPGKMLGDEERDAASKIGTAKRPEEASRCHVTVMMTKLTASLPPATSMQSFHSKQYSSLHLHTTFPTLHPPLLKFSLVNALLSTSAYLHALCTLFQPSTPACR